MKKRVLFVEDEEGIRITLAQILANEGFEVKVASSVSEALDAIRNHPFDILLSDLNIGEPSDGFTVVSAMRRVQPLAATLILTGYPDFESALVAIRNQVDDYLTKPADIKKLIHTLHEISPRLPYKTVLRQRISVIIRENRDEIHQRWLERCGSNAELSQIEAFPTPMVDHIPELILEIADRIEAHPFNMSEEAIKAAGNHGAGRYKQGFSIPMLVIEASILEKTISDLLQKHLLSIDISTLIADLQQMSEAIHCAIELSIRGFLQGALDVKVA